MFSRDGRFTKICLTTALTAGTAALLALPLFVASTAHTLYRINQEDAVRVAPTEWTWISQVRLGIDQPAPPVAQVEEAAATAVAPTPTLALEDRIEISHAAPTRVRTHHKKKSIVRALVETETQIVAAAPTPAESTGPASEDELRAFREMHILLRSRLHLAMTIQPADATRVAAEDSEGLSQPVPVNTHVNKKRIRKPRFVAKAVPAEAVQIAEPEKARTVEETQVLEAPSRSSVEQKSADLALRTDSSDAIQTSAAATVRGGAEYSDAEQTGKISQDNAQSEESAEQSDEKPGRQGEAAVAKSDSGELQITDKPISEQRKIAANLPFEVAAAKLWAEYSAADQAKRTASDVVIQPVVPASAIAAVPPAPVDYPHESSPPSHVKEAGVGIAQADSVSGKLVEAFGSASIEGGAISQLTSEGESADGRQSGWILAEAADHWSTLARSAETDTPMVSRNSAILLGTLAGAMVQDDAGMVFGKLPAGWSVRISGRAERPVFLNTEGQTVAAQDVEKERRFAFINVAPGSHLIYLTNRLGVEEGAIGIAVLGGVSTYLDLSDIRKVNVAGRVLDGGSAESHPEAQANVRALGSLAGWVQVDAQGKFKIDGVVTSGDHPILLETEARDGYTHRYQIHPSDFASATLYRLDASSVQTFLNQLEGSISPASGIVLGAMPNLIASEGSSGKLKPSVRALGTNPNLEPETYTLSSTGQLQVDAPMDAQSIRMLSVQVPEGPALLKTDDMTGKTRWSEMIFASPGVINLVGPY